MTKIFKKFWVSSLGLGNSLWPLVESSTNSERYLRESSVTLGSFILKGNCLIVSSEWRGSSDRELGKAEFSGKNGVGGGW